MTRFCRDPLSFSIDRRWEAHQLAALGWSKKLDTKVVTLDDGRRQIRVNNAQHIPCSRQRLLDALELEFGLADECYTLRGVSGHYDWVFVFDAPKSPTS